MSSSKPQELSGRLYGIGVGPGDPELLTLKAHRLLRQVPVLCVPTARPGEDSYALSIVQGLVDPARQEVLRLHFPMTSDDAELQACWEKAAATIAQRLAAGQDCAFLTEGDPFLYSTLVHLFYLLRERHPGLEVEVVPGVSSVNAAAARALLPLAQGDERVAIVPADSGGLAEVLRSFDTIVLLKVSRAFEGLLATLEALGLTEKAVLVQRATTAQEVIVRDIRTVRGQRLDYFSLVIVRK